MGNPRPTEANSAPLMDTINILLKASRVKHKFFWVDDGV